MAVAVQKIGSLETDKLVYTDTYHKDHIIGLAGINPIGPADAPSADTNGEGWLFAGGSTDNVAVLVTQINHDAKQGSMTIKPHLHWRKTTDASGAVKWNLEAKSAAPGGDFGAYAEVGTTTSVIASTVDNNTAARHLITDFGGLTLTVDLSTIVVFKLTRVASDTANDTYGANALAMSFDFHYEVDSPGSQGEYSK